MTRSPAGPTQVADPTSADRGVWWIVGIACTVFAAMIGHSVNGVQAAYLAGLVTLVALSYIRAALVKPEVRAALHRGIEESSLEMRVRVITTGIPFLSVPATLSMSVGRTLIRTDNGSVFLDLPPSAYRIHLIASRYKHGIWFTPVGHEVPAVRIMFMTAPDLGSAGAVSLLEGGLWIDLGRVQQATTLDAQL